MNSPIDEFLQRTFADELWFPRVPFDPEQPSVCSFGSIASDGMVQWRPVRREECAAVESLRDRGPEEVVAHAAQFLGAYWSSTLECRFGYEYLTLDCGAWNEQDFDRKQLALRDHLQMQSSVGRPLSMPLAWSRTGSECYFGLNLETGEVCLDELGKSPLQKVAESLPDFLAALQCVQATDDVISGYFE